MGGTPRSTDSVGAQTRNMNTGGFSLCSYSLVRSGRRASGRSRTQTGIDWDERGDSFTMVWIDIQTVRPNIDLPWEIHGRLKDISEERDVTLTEAYESVLTAGLERQTEECE